MAFAKEYLGGNVVNVVQHVCFLLSYFLYQNRTRIRIGRIVQQTFLSVYEKLHSAVLPKCNAAYYKSHISS